MMNLPDADYTPYKFRQWIMTLVLMPIPLSVFLVSYYFFKMSVVKKWRLIAMILMGIASFWTIFLLISYNL